MRHLLFLKKLFSKLYRVEPRNNFIIRPNPSVSKLSKYYLINHEIPSTENFGDC